VIARKDGERVRLWARTTSDCSNTFTRIRNAVAALPVESAVLDVTECDDHRDVILCTRLLKLR